jgi:hypothetical protein
MIGTTPLAEGKTDSPLSVYGGDIADTLSSLFDVSDCVFYCPDYDEYYTYCEDDIPNNIRQFIAYVAVCPCCERYRYNYDTDYG